ncbi:HD domain-containing protein [Nonomuraea sp. KM90]|uniref:HD domain-containing protein n=1 Tax=Nonomuraea sp. KM90 TaxID=3457428 RepID=UPI003FCE4CCD
MTSLVAPLLARLPGGFTASERDRIRRAYEFAAHHHAGQLRKSGDPYITHPVAVAEIAADAGLDCDAICAALLHDVIAGTECDAAQVRAEFGDETTALVQGMAELDRRHDQAALDAADDRVLALKVLDRLHNMRTLQSLDQAKRQLKSRQTLDVIAPLAKRLGLPAIADELEAIARGHLPRDTGVAHRALALGSLILPSAFRGTYLCEWLGELDVLRSRRAHARFAFGVMCGMPALALALRRPPARTLRRRLADLLPAGLRWVLRSNLRTWTPLAALLGWMVLETARSSLGDAVVILITVPPVLHTGVSCLRAKLGLDKAGG